MARAVRFGVGALLVAAVVAGGLLWNARQREARRATRATSDAPTAAPLAAPSASPDAHGATAGAPGPKPSPTPFPEATEAELEGLRAPRVADRARAVERMFDRRPSPAMAREVALAERTTVDTAIKRRLECLRVWAGDAETLAAGIARLPKDEAAYKGGLDRGQRCVLEVVAARAAEVPEKAADALAVIALAGTAQEREIARAGLARTTLAGRPRAIEEALQSDDAKERARAYAVVMALGAIAGDPAAVEACLADADVSEVCLDEALASPDGPRFLAGAIAGEEEDDHLWRLVAVRSLEDQVWPALVEVSRDRERPVDERRRALALLAERGDPALAPDLAPVLADPTDPVSADARRTLAAMQKRRFAEGT